MMWLFSPPLYGLKSHRNCQGRIYPRITSRLTGTMAITVAASAPRIQNLRLSTAATLVISRPPVRLRYCN